MHRLDPTLDLVFKLLLTREPELLRDMLQGILARPIHDFTVLPSDLPGELSGDKQVIFDIRAVLDDCSRVDLEMQRRTSRDLASRLVYYAARDYAGQLRRGDQYHLLTPTAGIVWLVDPLFPTLDRLHSIFELRERSAIMGPRFSDQLAFHVLQLPYLRRSSSTGYTGTVERWARFLVAKSDAEFDQLASEDPIMSTAKQTLKQLSQDPEVRRILREREDEITLNTMDLMATRIEAEAKGKAELLLKQLGLRFGRLPEAARARLEVAKPEQLDAWAERILTAKSLDEVFAP